MEEHRWGRVRIEEGRLIALRPGQHGSLARALATAREGKRALVQLAHGEEQVSLVVLPLSPRLGCPDALLIVFGLRNAWRSLTLEFFAQACRLTTMEARVMRALSDGLTPGQIACRHGVAISTVRTHLASVRNKTGSRSLIELVRALNALPPIMPTVVGVA